MQPMNQMGMRNPETQTSGNSAMLNTISSQGMPQAKSLEESQEPSGSNPAEQFLSDFSQAFNPIKDLLANPNYSFATKEADLVKRSLENFMEAVVTGLSVQAGQGGESLGNSSY